MNTVVFLQSETDNPYELYSQMLETNPVFWDHKNKLWGIYSYAACRRILTEPTARVPALNNRDLNEYALFMVEKFVRLNNPPHHQMARQVAMKLFEKMKE